MNEPALFSESLLHSALDLRGAVRKTKGKIDALFAKAYNIPADKASESKAWKWGSWEIHSTSNEPLATITDLTITYIRATDFNGSRVGYITMALNVTTFRVALWSGGQLHVQSKTAQGGILEDWDTGTLKAGCGDNNAYRLFQKNFNPDWYDILSAPAPFLLPSSWHHCG